jgi:hypothetical protein
MSDRPARSDANRVVQSASASPAVGSFLRPVQPPAASTTTVSVVIAAASAARRRGTNGAAHVTKGLLPQHLATTGKADVTSITAYAESVLEQHWKHSGSFMPGCCSGL